MQYIKKQNTEPADWNNWFTVPPNRRSYDYGADDRSLPDLRLAKSFLINEQHSLCAYCQQKITLENASIEHVTPKEHNKELSTNYFNLVAVCKKQQVLDPLTGNLHCDSTRGSELLPPLIFYSNAQSTDQNLNKYFSAYSTREVVPKHRLDMNTKNQVEAFISQLNLNHSIIKNKRAKDVLTGISIAANSVADKQRYWRAQYTRILLDLGHPFREYLLVYIGPKIGLN
ncbi:retron system putative HNH endonuclease [Flavobacterium aurantiibacter]|uniref:TIGR02646 family protein n=1 Tax=Flavobacterium aurantiibacter TaxID=2023067 RepID=A0A255ZC45_9FLAO|nr:retron system putative HNH endonuclease [Flavobacterium aurantiibacter]OYQ38445.1 TIGR02646 family protein [Flavobacterium aurantiibacter]